MRIKVTAEMVVEVPDDKVADDGTIVGSESWPDGPTTAWVHVRQSVKLFTASAIGRQVGPVKYEVREENR